jgi:hypothetical protein
MAEVVYYTDIDWKNLLVVSFYNVAAGSEKIMKKINSIENSVKTNILPLLPLRPSRTPLREGDICCSKPFKLSNNQAWSNG